jgi:exosome complex component RRP4
MTSQPKRPIVVPGMMIAEGSYNPGQYVINEDHKFYSTIIGLLEMTEKDVDVIPLKGVYIPKVGDKVIGIITNYYLLSWSVDINAPYEAILMAAGALAKPLEKPGPDLGKFLNIGDVIVAVIQKFDRLSNPQLTLKEPECGKVIRGTLVEITPSKVPRLIGKKGSLINLIKKELDVKVVVGHNGRVLIIGDSWEREQLAAEIVRKVETEAHVPGLTDRITKMIEEWKKNA